MGAKDDKLRDIVAFFPVAFASPGPPRESVERFQYILYLSNGQYPYDLGVGPLERSARHTERPTDDFHTSRGRNRRCTIISFISIAAHLTSAELVPRRHQSHDATSMSRSAYRNFSCRFIR